MLCTRYIFVRGPIRHSREKVFHRKNVNTITTSYYLTENVTAAQTVLISFDDDVSECASANFSLNYFHFLMLKKQKIFIKWHELVLFLSFDNIAIIRRHLCVFIRFDVYFVAKNDAKECRKECSKHTKMKHTRLFL